jgi:hypothetical protein
VAGYAAERPDREVDPEPDNSASESRRKWYNQITGTEDAWVDPRWVEQTKRPTERIADGESVVMFGDGSKSNDATGLVLCRMSDGFIQTWHHQQPTADQLVNRADVDSAVVEAFDRFDVVAFFFDPSHAKANDEVEDDRFWWPLVDQWHLVFGDRLKVWAVKSGPNHHSVAFDMLKPGAQAQFQPAVSQLAEDMKAETAFHHGGAILMRHMKNARRRDGRYGTTIGKETRSSARKVDLAVCAIGARMLWRMVQLGNVGSKPPRTNQAMFK